ncbi:xanthine dehydrogenase accessory factor [Aequitasia blattaphilus]|uniref:Selenium-dependent molybdenum cofactor biosynthesis protein YqeB n=1 Tax=Aequitasia blattaphilus TaxID=2949332 RepID=A0ABT1E9A3_9FIRM|nr:selenium-dependent molybdenum cofactor biosynthesis protein YqeB [Aequitasia blattaphilus]MCP1102405.1 selenium-dependent molybdenum cofactor biosynthesis protein YqeB [Aequitasia blattaphilus]MCR8615045.1 selenium-dependent molybdenum cofactor biosynthesis protein YqeB [Aequitasia blattaphilus]
MRIEKKIICVRGAGDLATGVIQKLVRSGYQVYALEIERPTAIRRQVALSTAITEGHFKVEDIVAERVECTMRELERCWSCGHVPIVVDSEARSVYEIEPIAVIDGILAKKNLGTGHSMAPITIGLGPGFSAPEDVDAVIETVRGHSLGRLILAGKAKEDTGVPGEIGGRSQQRVLHAPREGTVKHLSGIGDWILEGEPIFKVDNTIVKAPFSGTLRGLIGENMYVKKGMKSADIDPRRLTPEEVYGISDKARCIGGAVLEACLYLAKEKSTS